MERRNKSVKALKELIYIDSLDPDDRASGLVRWNVEYLQDSSINDFDLEIKELKQLSELFFKNINFLKEHKENTRIEILRVQKMKKFLIH